MNTIRHFISGLFCLLLIGNCLLVNAQEKKMASRQTTENPREWLKEAAALPPNKAKQALELIEKALLYGLKSDNKLLQADSYLLLGQINENLKQYDLAEDNYQKAFQFYKESGNLNGKLKSLFALGKVEERVGNYDRALKYYREYVSIHPDSQEKVKTRASSEESAESNYSSRAKRESNDVFSELEQVRLAISGVLTKQKRYKESINTLDQISEDATAAPSPEKEIMLNTKKGAVFEEQQKPATALKLYEENKRLAEGLNKPLEVAKANAQIAEIYSTVNKTEAAIDLRKKSIAIYRQHQDRAHLAAELLELAHLENEKNALAESEKHNRESVEIARELDLCRLEQDALMSLSALMEKKGDLRSALVFLKQYQQLREKATAEIKLQKDSSLSIGNSVNRELQRIELLEKNSELSDKTIEILRKNERITTQTLKFQKVLIIGLISGLLLISIAGYLMYRNIQQKKIANQLLALKSLRSQMNPHFIFNALNAVNHYIAKKDERSANKYLSEFSRLMRAVLEHSQKDFTTLQVELEIMSLYLILEHDRFREKFEYELEVDPKLDRESIMIPPMLVQPFVENAIWHGLRYKEDMGKLFVSYKLLGDKMQITIADNGIGRVKSKQLKTENQLKNSSTGIINISRRVEIINDMFGSDIVVNIHDLPNETGTLVEIFVAIKPEA